MNLVDVLERERTALALGSPADVETLLDALAEAINERNYHDAEAEQKDSYAECLEKALFNLAAAAKVAGLGQAAADALAVVNEGRVEMLAAAPAAVRRQEVN